MKRHMALALNLSAYAAMAGVTYTWTGAQDAYWTNAANWRVGGDVASVCPGVTSNVVNGVFAPDLPKGDTAVFGADGAGRTTVDLDGLYSVQSVVVTGADAPRYTFGTGLAQTLPFETNGSFVVEANVPSANCPTIDANLAFPVNVDSAWWGNNRMTGTQFTFENGTAGTLTLKGTFNTPGLWFRPDAANREYMELTVKVKSEEGAFAFHGDQHNNAYLYSYEYDAARIELYGCAFTGSKNNTYRRSMTVYVDGDSVFGYLAANNAGHTVGHNVTVKVTGPGDCRFAENADGRSFDNHAMLDLASGRLEVTTRSTSFTRTNPGAAQNAPCAIFCKSGAGGVLALAAETPGDYEEGFYVTGRMAIEIPSVSQLASCGALWLCGTNRFFNIGELRSWGLNYANLDLNWKGDRAETFVTAVTNHCNATPQVFTLRNAGSAALTAGMKYHVGGEATSLALDGETATIVYDAEIAGGEAKVTLSGDIVFPAGMAAEGVASFNLDNVSLSVEEGAASSGLPPICVAGGTNVIEFVGADVTLNSLTRTGGVLDMRSPTANRMFLPGLRGSDVSWLTCYGSPVEIGDDGAVSARSKYAHTVEIAARGDTVADGAEAIVGITTDGTTGHDVLGADATAVGGVILKTEASSTIAIGDSQSLSAGVISRTVTAGTLTVGDVQGRGSVSGNGGGIAFDNESPLGGIVVNAALECPDAMVRVTGAGRTEFRGGTKDSAPGGDVRVEDGTAVFAGGDYVFSRLLVSSNSQNAASSAIITNATVELSVGKGVQAGGVGGLYGSNDVQRIGGRDSVDNRLVIADGGKLLLAGDKTDIESGFADRTFHLGLNGNGVMEVCEGGEFSGRLMMGGWPDAESSMKCGYGFGTVLQRGGVVTAWGHDGNDYRASSGMGGFLNGTQGYYELKGGRFEAFGCFVIGYYGPGGVFSQTAGYSVISNTPSSTRDVAHLLVGATNMGEGRIRVKDSRMDVFGQIAFCQTFAGEARSDMIVDGDGAEIDTHGISPVNMICNNEKKEDKFIQATVSIVNGGTFAASYFNCGRATAVNAQYGVVNFDRGTLRVAGSGQDIVRNAIPLRPVLRSFLVGPGGAAVDTAGNLGNSSSVPFAAPETGVVTGIEGFSPIRDCLTCPKVNIDGDGYGAVAFAEYDSELQMVTNITIVAGGTGYTKAEVKLYCGAVAMSGCTYAATVGGPVSGSFTKRGAGDFTLLAANTYGGDTILEGGILRLGVEDAIPEGTAIVCAGGTLETAAAFCPASLKVKVPNSDTAIRAEVVRFSDSVPNPLPDVEVVNARAGTWFSRVSGNTLKVIRNRGMTMVVR